MAEDLLSETVINRLTDSVKNASSKIGETQTNDTVLNNLANMDIDNDAAFPNSNDNFNCFDGECQVDSPCKRILWEPIHSGSSVRTWDLLILIPNLIFLVIIIAGNKRARSKLRSTHSPIFGAFYSLVFTNTAVSVIRCLVAMAFSAYPNSTNGSSVAIYADKLLWIVLRYFMLATEMSVIVFALASGHLDSKTSIRRVVMLAAGISMAYSLCQCILEFHNDVDLTFDVENGKMKLFAHGGSIFWMISSLVFALFYLMVVLMPILPCRKYLSLPNKKSFYYYIGFMTALNALQWGGSLELVCGVPSGLCLVNLTTFLYFTSYTPIVYYTFLRPFFKTTQEEAPSFLYKAQLDEFEEEMVNNESIQVSSNPIIINGYRRLDADRKVEEDAAPLATSSSAFPGEI